MLLNERSHDTDGAGSSHDGCAYQQTGCDTLFMETISGVKRQDAHNHAERRGDPGGAYL